jgi:hypothetical protein
MKNAVFTAIFLAFAAISVSSISEKPQFICNNESGNDRSRSTQFVKRDAGK